MTALAPQSNSEMGSSLSAHQAQGSVCLSMQPHLPDPIMELVQMCVRKAAHRVPIWHKTVFASESEHVILVPKRKRNVLELGAASVFQVCDVPVKTKSETRRMIQKP